MFCDAALPKSFPSACVQQAAELQYLQVWILYQSYFENSMLISLAFLIKCLPETFCDRDKTSAVTACRRGCTFSPVDKGLRWCELSPFPAGFLTLTSTACQSHQCNPTKKTDTCTCKILYNVV